MADKIYPCDSGRCPYEDEEYFSCWEKCGFGVNTNDGAGTLEDLLLDDFDDFDDFDDDELEATFTVDLGDYLVIEARGRRTAGIVTYASHEARGWDIELRAADNKLGYYHWLEWEDGGRIVAQNGFPVQPEEDDIY